MAQQKQTPDDTPAVPPFNIVNRHNLLTLSLSISHVLSRASFVAVDTEFTGLGDPKKTKAQDVSERYLSLAQLARTHAITAFGITVFEADPGSTKTSSSSSPRPPLDNLKDSGNSASSTPTTNHQHQFPTKFIAHNFQFTMLCRSDHMVSPSSTTFLAEHGFDFNDQILNGIPYSPGDDKPNESPTDTNAIMRSIFTQILSINVPIIVHNGLLDIMFMYQSFYANLPSDLSTFVADLHGMFGGGVYDTKYISDFVTRESRSFLSYLFRKYQRYQERQRDQNQMPYLSITTRDRITHMYTRTKLTLAQLGLQRHRGHQSSTAIAYQAKKRYCVDYANHGVCVRGTKCSYSHDLDVILDEEEASTNAGSSAKKGDARGTKRKADVDGNAERVRGTESSVTAADLASSTLVEPQVSASDVSGGPETVTSTTAMAIVAASPMPLPATNGTNGTTRTKIFETYHSACFDAFMTGYVFLHQMQMHSEIMASVMATKAKSTTATLVVPDEHRNRLYLMGKSMPLRIEGSLYAKPSAQHDRKIKEMHKKRQLIDG